MVLPEIPLQVDLFTGSLRDTRTRTQKEEAQEREQPQPTLMFRQRDIAQFGVRARPQHERTPQKPAMRISESTFRQQLPRAPGRFWHSPQASSKVMTCGRFMV